MQPILLHSPFRCPWVHLTRNAHRWAARSQCGEALQSGPAQRARLGHAPRLPGTGSSRLAGSAAARYASPGPLSMRRSGGAAAAGSPGGEQAHPADRMRALCDPVIRGAQRAQHAPGQQAQLQRAAGRGGVCGVREPYDRGLERSAARAAQRQLRPRAGRQQRLNQPRIRQLCS